MNLPQPVTGLVVALVILGLVLFISPPAARLWIAALVLVMVIAARGKAGAAIIDKFSQTFYGRAAK